MGSPAKTQPDCSGLAEIYGTPPTSFLGRDLHPIVYENRLTELEQDLEAELRRRGHDHVPYERIARGGSVKVTVSRWALSSTGYVPGTEDLERTVDEIADAIQKGEA